MRRFFTLLIIVAGFTIVTVAQKPDSSAKPDPGPAPATVKLPSAKEIADKYAKALGGAEALRKYKTRYEKGTMELSPMGVKGSFESFARSDDRTLTRISLDGIGEILEGFDGSTAWTVNPLQGSRVKEGKELEQTKSISRFARDADLEKAFSAMRVKGIEKVGERDTYVVVGSTEGLPDEILYFDIESGLMLRRDSIVIAPEGQQATTTFIEDYRENGGIRLPYKTRVKSPAFEIISVVNEVKFDVAMDDSKFKRPN